LLISAGANVNATDNEDDTPLLLACKKGMLEMATMLKDAGAAINVANEGGDTPLLPRRRQPGVGQVARARRRQCCREK
jgi:ankyrin repeat protein